MVASTWHVPALTKGDATWTRLAELVASNDVVLHGSRTSGLAWIEPRAPLDFSLDDFSKTTAVYATEDPTWAIAYAIRSSACRRFLNACFYPGATPGKWSERRIFLSFASTEDGRMPTNAGVVYVLPSTGFTRMPSYTDPALGLITECQLVSTDPVAVLAEIPVEPENLPITPLLHNFEAVSMRAAGNPGAFPWLD
ncbi:hypothetical protein [Paeniglutamicibacter sulfureus]|uniref:RES domain-containing protein n=1 Tax=Paeniglutamicibacter sulfureus TaxID=43666 RepID=A0ABU2BEX0_9MICC|nr:hypothetical protein [Paeniglutamicibacter sulfureus]MDR7357188.1 hypothetical protein [Paeniglutamicibacter sulfureus]